ncbi:MAG: iron-containing alcohol dehydrogenase [Candidatus Omnitrophota bacterium]|nr:iron-containing alcohol dehydrogenase [Candidatus Omnitrophota bacterium]
MNIGEFPEILYLPQKTIFKKGASLNLCAESFEFGRRGLIVHGNSLNQSKNKEKILKQFPSLAKVDFFCRKSGEPTLDEISEVIRKAKAIKAEWIVGVGGGSVLDLAKAAAGLYNARKKPVFYQEGGTLKEKGIPFIAVPTTCGSGAEVTPNSVITNSQKKTKLSIRDASFLARTVILDVELLFGLTKTTLSYCAMDAFVQAYESFTSRNSTWFSEGLSLKAIELINENIICAHERQTEENLSALLLGSYLAGVAFSSSRLGIIHGIAHPLGVFYGLAHGLICAVCFIPSIKVNKETMGKKYDIISKVLGVDFERRVEALLKTFGISSPFKNKELIEKEKIIKETLESGSTAANPKKITRKDVESILSEIF